MLQKSKILQSRNDWRDKAVTRAIENKELRKTKRRLQEKIAELLADTTQHNAKKNRCRSSHQEYLGYEHPLNIYMFSYILCFTYSKHYHCLTITNNNII